MKTMQHPCGRNNLGHKFNVHQNLAKRTYELRIKELVPSIACPVLHAQVTWVNGDPSSKQPPTISFDDNGYDHPMQGLLDALWDAGLRPSLDSPAEPQSCCDPGPI
jgi:hypothetical protein